MPTINRYVDISTIDREAKKDYIDRHSPFIHCEAEAKKGQKFYVTVKMGNDYSHPDDFDHYIASIALYNGETLLAKADFMAGALGNEKGHQEVTFAIVPTGKSLNLVAHGYCTKHGIWESTPVVVSVSE